MIVVYLTEVGDLYRVSDQLGVVIAGRRRGRWGLQPAQPGGAAQQSRRYRAKSTFGSDDRPLGLRHVLGDDDLEFRQGGGKPRSPVARRWGLWRQHQELGGHRRSSGIGARSG